MVGFKNCLEKAQLLPSRHRYRLREYNDPHGETDELPCEAKTLPTDSGSPHESKSLSCPSMQEWESMKMILTELLFAEESNGLDDFVRMEYP